MEMFGIIFGFVALILIGIGLAVGLVACGLLALLVGLGVLSSSAFLGIRSGRPEVAIRAFFVQCGCLAGIPAGAVCAWFATQFQTAIGTGWVIFVYGGIGGAVAGVLIALILDFVTRQLYRWASSRFPAESRVIPSTHSSLR
jgi:hypothetical protein